MDVSKPGRRAGFRFSFQTLPVAFLGFRVSIPGSDPVTVGIVPARDSLRFRPVARAPFSIPHTAGFAGHPCLPWRFVSLFAAGGAITNSPRPRRLSGDRAAVDERWGAREDRSHRLPRTVCWRRFVVGGGRPSRAGAIDGSFGPQSVSVEDCRRQECARCYRLGAGSRVRDSRRDHMHGELRGTMVRTPAPCAPCSARSPTWAMTEISSRKKRSAAPSIAPCAVKCRDVDSQITP